ncbi:hypothetical protein NC652_023926 [Populus alba x Populus x berolinensis]|nr:hypothetical protein NC652_023926 [Populus alba x Populus x berolinensis]
MSSRACGLKIPAQACPFTVGRRRVAQPMNRSSHNPLMDPFTDFNPPPPVPRHVPSTHPDPISRYSLNNLYSN